MNHPTKPALSNPSLADSLARRAITARGLLAHEAPAAEPEASPASEHDSSTRAGVTPVPSEEVETKAFAVEVRILWGRNLLHVAHVDAGASFRVGEGDVDFALPAEKLGASVLTLVEAGSEGAAVLVPGLATGWSKAPDQATKTALGDASNLGRIPLVRGSEVRLQIADLTFELRGVARGRKVSPAFAVRGLVAGSALLYVLASGAGVGGMLAATAFFTPEFRGTGTSEITDEQRYLLSHFLTAAAEKEVEEQPDAAVSDAPSEDASGGTGTRAKGSSGSMGSPSAASQGHRYSVAGPHDHLDPHLARQAALREAADFGMVGILNHGVGGDPDAPTAPWGRDDSLGNDPLSFRGSMWGDAPGESFGVGGLGLTGIGEGGDGRGEGLGLGNISTLGHGAGAGEGLAFGNGVGGGRLGRGHRVASPSVRIGGVVASGHLPPEVIQRIVRQNFGRFRSCYESGLRGNPALSGTVSVRFVIGRDGAVSNVGAGGTLPDAGVTGCVARSFASLSFPRPDESVVRVTYPITFVPG